MTHLLDDIARRLGSAWRIAVRAVAAGVFGLAIALTITVFVVGPETREDWRALPAQVASGEVSLPVVGDLLARVDGTGPADDGAQTAEGRTEAVASRGSDLRTSGLSGRLNPFLAHGSQPFVVSGTPAPPAPATPAVPTPEPVVPVPAEPVPAEAVPVEAAPQEVAPKPVATVPPAAPVAAAPAPAAPGATAGMNEQATEVLRLVNVQRTQAGCSELRPDAQLTAAAQLHSADMSANNYMSHTSLDGRSPSDRAGAQGYGSFSGENVAKGYRSAADVMDGWMNSPGHRANILSCTSVAIGVGVSGDAWTQVFGYA